MARRRRARKYMKLTNVLSDREYEDVLRQARDYLRSFLKRWQVEFDGRQTNVAEWLAQLAWMYEQERSGWDEPSLRNFARFHGAPYDQLVSQVALERNRVDSGSVLAYYSRPEIQESLLRHARERQLLLHYNGPYVWGFRSSEDIVALAFWIMHRTRRWPSFHASIARYDELGQRRRDVVFEVDHQEKDWRECFGLTRPLIRLLRREGIPFRIKYSGNASAHIIVPAEVLPQPSDGYYAELYRFARSQMKKPDTLDMTFAHDPYHLLRLPYALHETTGLASLPIPEDSFDTFSPTLARLDKAQVLPEWWSLSVTERLDGQAALRKLLG